ncbi:MAG: tocopherol cyclase family protein [Candidatus Neomarinimicrobiota bacterium]|jgi:hypothetical protein
MNKLSNPPVFQGSLNKKSYFEGWYIKCLSDDLISSIAFIPGLSLGKDPHAFIQINRSNNTSEYIRFPVEEFSYKKDVFAVALGDNYFSDRGLRLNYEQNGISLQGDLVFNNIQRYPSRFLAPGIMGIFTYIPFMQCYHGVVSIRHEINGLLTINGQDLGFDKGRGYIEKDWGRSFPKSWLWMQANPFHDSEASFMLSIAKIPWMGMYFTGIIGFLNDGNKTYRFATYLGDGLSFLEEDEGGIYLYIKGPKYHLRVYAEFGDNNTLIAPVKGHMDRNIKESLNSSLHVELSDKGHNIIFRDSSHIAGLETSGDIDKL